MPLNCVLKVVKMGNSMFCVFYQNKKKGWRWKVLGRQRQEQGRHPEGRGARRGESQQGWLVRVQGMVAGGAGGARAQA